MARKPQVTFFASKNAYFTTINGNRHRLANGPDDAPGGPNHQAAIDRYNAIIFGTAKDGDSTVNACIERYLDHARKSDRQATIRAVESCLKNGQKKWGKLLVSQLKTHIVESWLDSEKRWNSTTRHMAYSKFVAILNWNVKQDHISSQPLAKKKKPDSCDSRSRGAEFAHSLEFLNLLVSEAQGRFKDYLTLLLDTGCRPGEACGAEVYHYQREKGAIIFKGDCLQGFVWKNAKKKKRGDRDRYIYLSPRVVDLVERNIKRQKTGHIFRSRQSGGYSYQMVRMAFSKLRQKPAVKEYMALHGIDPAHVILYSFRHSYATRSLGKGTPVATLAHLMGTSVQMIESHYGHLSKEQDAMRTAYLATVG